MLEHKFQKLLNLKEEIHSGTLRVGDPNTPIYQWINRPQKKKK